jgi:predicted histidine transporter YuiF (NhaC family)
MLSSYKEIVYGIALGVGAAVFDTILDAKAENQSFAAEIGSHPAMMLYRALFVLFGLIVGWLVWRNRKREHELQRLMDEMRRFHQEYEARSIVLHTNLQLLLTKALNLPPDGEALLRSTYEKSRELQALAKQRPMV